MKKFQPKTRSGRVIKNYRKRVDFVIPGVPSGVKVPGTTTGDLEKSLKILKRQVKDMGVFEELRDRREFEKKSAKKRKQMNRAIRSLQKMRRMEAMNEKDCWTFIIDGKAQ